MTATTGSGVDGMATASQVPYYTDEDADMVWLFFAGSMLGLAGIMRILDSIWAFSYHGALPDDLKDGVLGSSLHNYAWLWLAVGVVLLGSSFLVLVRSQFARWIGVFGAAVGAISAVAWLPYYPVWSLIYISMAILVFYGLLAHGGRVPR
jgi:hypothetical protein